MGPGLPQLWPFVGAVSKPGNSLWRGRSGARAFLAHRRWPPRSQSGIAWSWAQHRLGASSRIRCVHGPLACPWPSQRRVPGLLPGRLLTGSFGLEQDAVPQPLPFVIGMAASRRNRLLAGKWLSGATGIANRRPRREGALQPLLKTSAVGSSVLSKVLESAEALGHICGAGVNLLDLHVG